MALEFYYQIQRQDAAGKTHTYQVEEYFKIRYGGQRMYLLDYSRTMEEYLTQENLEAGTNDLSLGVAGNDLTYFSNETGTVVAFVPDRGTVSLRSEQPGTDESVQFYRG